MSDLSSSDRPAGLSRRRFLQAAAAAPAALGLGRGMLAAAGPAAVPATAGPNGEKLRRVSEHLWIYRGPIHTGVLVHDGKALLIDCGDGSVAGSLQAAGVTRVEQLLFTHHHRDQACGAYEFVAAGAKVVAPAGERDWFEKPGDFWGDDANLWRVYRSFRPGPLSLVEPLGVDRALGDGDEIAFGPARIRVLDTPGHSEGSVSYLVEVDGRRVVFCGDLLCGEGQIWDVHSLQRGFAQGGSQIGGYHGFMGDRWRLAESLARVRQLQPELLVTSHGAVLDDAAAAIDLLVERLEACYENYVAVSALRHYFPKLFTEYEGRPGQMPIRPGIQPPDCLRHFGTTWMIVSESGGALVMDAGSPRLVERFQKMLESGEIKSIDALWVTHYHADHTDGIPAFQKAFDCPTIMDRRLADVMTRPTAWRLPCLAPDPIRVERVMDDGQSWPWREFKLTAFFFPGQTLYHDALLAEAGDLKMLFVGDSHTPSGIDDYCAQNRNWLGRGVGFQYCLDLIEKLRPTHIFNCHVDDAFTFTPGEIRFMRETLDRREKLFGELVGWEHANYGLDPSWVRADPYTQPAAAGGEVTLDVMMTNHSAEPRAARVRAILPKPLGGGATPWVEALVPPKTERPLQYDFALPLRFSLPQGVPPGRYVVPIDVEYAGRLLPQLAEAIVDLGGP